MPRHVGRHEHGRVQKADALRLQPGVTGDGARRGGRGVIDDHRSGWQRTGDPRNQRINGRIV